MPADKGGAVVTLDGDHYNRMVANVLNDPEYFEACKDNQMQEIIGKISLQKIQLGIDKRQNLLFDKFQLQGSQFLWFA